MTVNIGDSVTAASFNSLADLIDDWFEDGCGACSFGDPNQKFGWGGSAVSDKIISDNILAADFNKMIDRINIGVDIVDGVAGNLAQVVIGNNILASDYNNIDAKEVSIRALKNTIDAAELSDHGARANTRTTNWSASIDNICKYTFGNFSKARYFFNSGGAISEYLGAFGGSTGNAASWTTLLSTMGTVIMDLDGTSQTGSGGTPAAIGYYDLTTSWQQIFIQSAAGAYSDNEIIIYAKRNVAGNEIEIRTLLNDDHTGTVDCDITSQYRYRKLDDQSSGVESLIIAAPSSLITDTFE